jgi:hypothetical protein
MGEYSPQDVARSFSLSGLYSCCITNRKNNCLKLPEKQAVPEKQIGHFA